MKISTIVVGLLGILLALVLLVVVARQCGPAPAVKSTAAATSPAAAPATAPAEAIAPADAPAEARPGFIYGRITADGGAIYEGRLRWGLNEEAFWGDYFNGAKGKNAWASFVPPERLITGRTPVKVFGIDILHHDDTVNLGRLFMARFGDIARIEAHGTDVKVILKSGSTFHLKRFEASDFDDDVRVWDGKRGVVDLDSLQIHSIELLPTAPLVGAPDRLHGTVRTRQGEFTGFVQWDREACIGSDELEGRDADGEQRLRFDAIRSIEHHSEDSATVKMLDGRELVLSGSRHVGMHNRGIYVDDPRFGRVLISWDAFERLDLQPGGSGPAYTDFPPGQPLSGSVTTRDGRRLAGRVVFDLDESETTETLDAPAGGVDYTIPMGLVASIVPETGAVTLHHGEQLKLEAHGDLGEGNAGLLVFVDAAHPDYVRWSEVARIDFDRPTAMYPPLAGH